MILAILVLALVAGVFLTAGVLEDSPGSVLFGAIFLTIAGVLVGRLM